jgi:predicted RNA-binding protein with PIN domain
MIITLKHKNINKAALLKISSKNFLRKLEKYKRNIRKVKKKPLNKKNQKNKQRIMENLY